MEDHERIKEALINAGVPYLNIIKCTSDNTCNGEYIDSKHPERNFTFENARLIIPSLK